MNTRTLKQIRRRRSEIIGELVKLSHGGWANARREDWEPLEIELNSLTLRLGR